jgi:tetratricopeptide (TPR) repeat protein
MYLMIISLHAYGTYQRNIVWSSYERLWHDAVLKSPNSSEAMMGYGLALMLKGQYDEAKPYFERTLLLYPNWAYINVNMGILKDDMGLSQEAEPYFRKAIRSQPYYPIGYSEYARFLMKHGRKEEAIAQLEAGIKISPGDASIIEMLNSIKAQPSEKASEVINEMAKSAEQNPTADSYINLSLTYYQNHMYRECIEACKKALKLKPDYAMAYNNICSSYNALGQWDKGVEACKKALEIDPNFALAKTNLNWAKKNLK